MRNLSLILMLMMAACIVWLTTYLPVRRSVKTLLMFLAIIGILVALTSLAGMVEGLHWPMRYLR